jgi:hypothetical protein
MHLANAGRKGEPPHSKEWGPCLHCFASYFLNNLLWSSSLYRVRQIVRKMSRDIGMHVKDKDAAEGLKSSTTREQVHEHAVTDIDLNRNVCYDMASCLEKLQATTDSVMSTCSSQPNYRTLWQASHELLCLQMWMNSPRIGGSSRKSSTCERELC